MKVKTKHNPKLSQDEVVEDIMDKLMLAYPQIHGYTWERVGEEVINILIYGDIEIINGS